MFQDRVVNSYQIFNPATGQLLKRIELKGQMSVDTSIGPGYIIFLFKKRTELPRWHLKIWRRESGQLEEIRFDFMATRQRVSLITMGEFVLMKELKAQRHSKSSLYWHALYLNQPSGDDCLKRVVIPKEFTVDMEEAICSTDGMKVYLKGDKIKGEIYMDTVYMFDFE